MNFVFISPNFPHTYWQFCNRLQRIGINVLGIGDAPYNELEDSLKSSLSEYYRVNSLENYSEVYEAVNFFKNKYGKIDWIESNNEYWLEQDAKLRQEFNITTGILPENIIKWKHKSLMHKIYKKAGIKKAEQEFITNIENAEKFIEKYNYPIIVKPDIGVGSSNTWKIKNKDELMEFFNKKPEVPYVMEEFIEGEIYSYDAIINSKSEPLFESMTIWPPSIADIVDKDLDLSYFVSKNISEELKNLGRRAVKAFEVKSRFVHLEFFRLTKPHKNIGEIGDFAALEVNMRPAGGYTPDMMDFAHSTDVYQIWADMVKFDKKTDESKKEDHYCVYASRKDKHKYIHTNEEILNKYGNKIVMMERMPEIMHETMGCMMYTAIAENMEEVKEFIDFVQKKGAIT